VFDTNVYIRFLTGKEDELDVIGTAGIGYMKTKGGP
jgi:hypothetical protein